LSISPFSKKENHTSLTAIFARFRNSRIST
jgi:hypothetical protein